MEEKKSKSKKVLKGVAIATGVAAASAIGYGIVKNVQKKKQTKDIKKPTK